VTATQSTYRAPSARSAALPAGTAPRFDPGPEPRRQPRPAPAPAGRPHLRLVDPAEARRRRLTRMLTGFLLVAVCAGLFAIVALRVVLAQGQGEIDRLEASVDARTATGQQLRLRVAELEAPAQVVAAARTRLGMVTPGAVTYLNPPPVPAP
jgi:cell division protein FtsB